MGQMGQTKHAPYRIRARERVREALVLRQQGRTYAEIGAALGISESAAWRAVARAYQRLQAQADEEAAYQRALDLARLDAALAAIWPQVQQGRLLAIDRLIAILERRARLLGLDAPQRQEHDIGEVLASYLQRLAGEHHGAAP